MVLRFGVPIAVLLIFTLIAWLLDADLEIARLVHVENKQWPGVGNFPWDFLYDYGVLPAFILAGAGLAVLLAGFILRRAARYRSQALFLVLLLAVGPGLVVNVILKDNHGRPRPREIIEFGGKHHFTQIWERGETGRNSSFPSGHASAGFYLVAPWFLLRRRHRPAAAGCLLAGLSYGSLVGAARIMQGGHFLTDVVWAGGLVYLTGEALALVLRPEKYTGSDG
jgi:membrane-associated PAP2 superfamily phosphatase